MNIMTPQSENGTDDINTALAEFGLRIDVLPIDSLIAYPRNNKKHGQKDLAAIFSSIKSFGFKDVIIADKDLEIIAGHGRVLAAKEKGLKKLPVLIATDLSKTQAKAYRIAHNRSANIAKYDDDILTKELGSLREENFPLEDFAPLKLEKWLEPLDIPEFNLETFEVKGPEEIRKEDVPDTLFASDNDWGIPVLNPKMQADFVDLPFVQWGDVSRKNVQRGTFHFYTDDFKFDSLWNDPTGPLQSKCVTIVEPNFSTGPQFPRYQAMCLIGRKRWLARYWQEYGKRIIVDINIDPRLYDLAVLGVPKGWRAWATRAQPHIIHTLDQQFEVAKEHAGTDDILFVVYGGAKVAQEICQKNQWIWIEDRRSLDRAAWTRKMEKEMHEQAVLTKPQKTKGVTKK